MTTKETLLFIACFLAVGVLFFFAGRMSYKVDLLANKIQSECPFEGMECPTAQSSLQDYQLQFHYDTVWVYDGQRLVGSHIDNNDLHGSFIDSLTLADNQ